MININYRDSRPIYEQIKDGLKKMLLLGAIGKDEKLPSVRDLASQMSINPNTIQRAYRELEAEGYIYSVSGRGSFASGASELDNKMRTELEGRLTGTVTEMLHLGMKSEVIVDLVRRVIEDCGKEMEKKTYD